MLEVQEYALQHGSQYKLLRYLNCHKLSPLNAFPLKSRV